MTKWTASIVEDRLEEAAFTLRRLPPVKVQGYFGTWPAVVYDAHEAYGWEPQPFRHGPPSAAAISRMEETLLWFHYVDPDEHRLIWLRAHNVRWKHICWRMGYGRTTAWQRWVYALQKIATGLNDGSPKTKRLIRPEHANA